ncbi:MAG: ABC transporter permease [Pirellulaceae bacterium]
MNRWRFVTQSLRHHWRTNLAVSLGVAVATAVLIGALLVGDSVRGSLRDLALSRLGRTQAVVLSERYFRDEAVGQLVANFAEQGISLEAQPLMFMQGTVQTQSTDPAARIRLAGNVAILGIEAGFWDWDETLAEKPRQLEADELILNQPLANELGVEVGDMVSLRLPGGNDVPPDSPLGRKTDRVQGLPRMTVAEIVPAEGLGRFGLHPTQQLPYNAFVSRARLQTALGQSERTNAIFISWDDSDVKSPLSPAEISAAMPLTLEDFGFSLTRVEREFSSDEDPESEKIFDWWQLSSSRMMIGDAAAQLVREQLGDQARPVFTYLATSIGKGQPPADSAYTDDEIPYSTVTALGFPLSPYPLLNVEGNPIENLADDQVVLNQWTADRLEAAVGDAVYLTYFNPESTHGVASESSAAFTVAAITPLTTPDEPYQRRQGATYTTRPTTANDPDLTPTVEGITDQASINDWDPPFPYDANRVDSEDETYWDNFRTTPKVFLSLETARKLWGSRFGSVTSFRFAASDFPDEATLRSELEMAFNSHKSSLGVQVLAVRQDALRAAAGTTPFNVLFLGFSFFIIAAALLLVALLFRLGIEQRAKEIGTLMATGLNSRAISGMLTLEGAMVTAIGMIVGCLLGVGYAWLMLAGLRTWWLDAVVTPFLQLHAVPGITHLVALLVFAGIALGTIVWSIRGLGSVPVRSLLGGIVVRASTSYAKHQARWARLVAALLLAVAFALAAIATQLGGEAQAGAFLGSGAAVLSAVMLYLWYRFRNQLLTVRPERFSISQLAISNAMRNPGRSTLTIGLMAAACFLVIAIGSFRLTPSEQGAGGRDLMAESSQPIYHDLSTPQGRYDAGFTDDEETLLTNTEIEPLRVQPGDDASCLNLYQSNSPRVLGVTPRMIEAYSEANRVSFDWAASAAQTPEERSNPWLVLEKEAEGKEIPIPVVIDKNTAMYALHLYGGVGEQFETLDDDGRTTQYVVAGLISNSIFQGNLLVSEENFLKRFPDVNGYRMFLIRSPEGQSEEVAATLENRLADQGFDTTQTEQYLESLLAVQNTYISTFQSLGGLGLLLGTFGLAAVQLRNALERRGELALLQAAGFSRGRVGRLVLQETVILLLGGLATGIFAAAVTVVPHMIFGDATVPFETLGVTLLLILIAGLLSSFWAVRSTTQGAILPALRGD